VSDGAEVTFKRFDKKTAQAYTAQFLVHPVENCQRTTEI